MANLDAAVGSQLRRLFDEGGAAGLADGQLLDRLHERDATADAAFEAILTRHGPAVLATCRRVLGNSTAADDAFQAVFLVLLRRAGSVPGGEALRPWLLVVARRAALKARQEEQRRRAREQRASRPERMTVEDPSFDLHRLVRTEVERLPAKYREPIWLCYFEGQTHDSAASALGWPVGTVRGRLSRARALLGTRLARRGVTVTVTGVGLALAPAARTQAEVPRALQLATLEAAKRSGIVSAGAGALAASIIHDLATAAAVKIAAAALVVASTFFVGLGLTTLAGGENLPPQDPPRHARATSTRIEAPPHAPAVDLYHDPLPEGATARMGTLRFRHDRDGIHRVAFTPDAQTLLTVGDDQKARIWDVAEGRLRRTIEATQATFSGDGRTLLTLKGNQLRTLELATGREQCRVEVAPKERVQFLTPSPDGAIVAAILSREVDGTWIPAWEKRPSALVVYDTSTLGERLRLEGDFSHTRALAFAPDGRTLAVAGPDVVPRGASVNIATESSVRLFDLNRRVELRRFRVEGFSIASVAYAPDGKTLAVGVADRTVRLYETTTGRERLPRLAAGSPVPPPKPGEPKFAEGADRPQAAATLAFSPDGKTLAAGMENIGYFRGLYEPFPIILWDVSHARELRRFPGHSLDLSSLVFSSDGRTLASASRYDPQARVWDVGTGREASPRPGHRSEIRALAVSPADGTVFTGGTYEGIVRRWDPTTGSELGVVASVDTPIHGLTLSPDGEQLFLVTESSVIVWNVPARREVRRFDTDGAKPPIRDVVCAPDGRSFSAGDRVWDLATGQLRLSLHNKLAGPVRPFYSDDSRRLITVTPRDVRLWDLATGRELGCPIQGRPLAGHAMALSPDGRLVATFATSNASAAILNARYAPRVELPIQIWELASGRQVASLSGHLEPASSIVFAPDGRTLATTCGGRASSQGLRDSGIRIWDVADGRRLRDFNGHPYGTSQLAYLRDGRSLVSAGRDGTSLVWNLGELADRRPSIPRNASTWEALWADLASDDAPRGHRASFALSVPEAVPLLAARLRPAAPVAPSRIASLVAELDADRFAARTHAADELARIGSAAEPALRSALDRRPSREARARIERLLATLAGPAVSREQLRTLRAIAALERIGNPEARAVLDNLSRGAPEARESLEASAALGRLSRTR